MYHHLGTPAAPAFASRKTAGEAIENYWQALLSDIHFEAYGENALANAAARLHREAHR